MATLLTRDPLLIAILPVALRLPWFVFAVPAGIVTDRVDRRRLILAMDILRALAFSTAAIAVWLAIPLPETPDTGVSNPALFVGLIVAALTIGCAEVFRDNAAQTMLPALVPSEGLERANGRLWSVELVGNALIGPALGAFLLASFLPLPFALNALAFACAVIMVASLSGRFKPKQTQTRDWKRELKEGYDFLKNAALLRLLAIATGVWNLLDQMVVIALVLHVQENLGLGAKAYGLILAASAFGGIAAGFVADRIVKRFGPGQTARVASLISGFTFLAITFAPDAYVLALALMTFEFAGLTWNTVSVSYRQRRIPDRLLGRVNSLYRLLAWGMMPVGLILSGLVLRAAETVLPRGEALMIPFYIAAIGVFVLTALIWRPLKRGFQETA